MALQVVILAAGKGTRMFSNKPKVLHKVAGKPMLERVLNTAQALSPKGIHVIIGHEGETIQNAFSSYSVNWVWQKQQLGTGHAVMQALPYIPKQDTVLVLSADVPLIQIDLLNQLVDTVEDAQAAENAQTPLVLLLALLSNPTGLGRVLRDSNGHILAIREEKDANENEKKIQEIYSGVCCTSAEKLAEWLPQLSAGNAQKEYYLTDIIKMAADQAYPISFVHALKSWMIQGVNDRIQLESLERVWQAKQATSLMQTGVTIADKSRIDIRGELVCGQDVFIDVGCVFEGQVTLANNVVIGPNCRLSDTTVGEHSVIEANSVMDGALVGASCRIGPFARLRPGTALAEHCKVGNFVETKQVTFGANSKASHLTYLGDAEIGQAVNIGAGTITCNYDGANKHKTVIEDGAFIGSDTQLVAPVRVGKNATLGAGTTLRREAPADELTLTAAAQKTVTGWKRPVKSEDTAQQNEQSVEVAESDESKQSRYVAE